MAVYQKKLHKINLWYHHVSRWPDDDQWHPNRWMMTTRLCGLLVINGYTDVRMLLDTPDHEILRIPECGLKSLSEVRELREAIKAKGDTDKCERLMQECETV